MFLIAATTTVTKTVTTTILTVVTVECNDGNNEVITAITTVMMKETTLNPIVSLHRGVSIPGNGGEGHTARL